MRSFPKDPAPTSRRPQIADEIGRFPHRSKPRYCLPDLRIVWKSAGLRVPELSQSRPGAARQCAASRLRRLLSKSRRRDREIFSTSECWRELAEAKTV